MAWYYWVLIGIFPCGFCIWHSRGRAWTLEAFGWMLNKFRELMDKTEKDD